MANHHDRALAPALPANRSALIANRTVEFRRTLNDMVEDIHLELWDSEADYKEYLLAVYDEQAVEGSLAADNIKAAELIRDFARKEKDIPFPGDATVAKQKLATISKALGVVLRRYDISRKDRRDMLHGETVPGNNGD